MRPLTQRQAKRCEEAETKRCRCRCKGAYHGAKRGDVLNLYPDDPHHAEPPKEGKR